MRAQLRKSHEKSCSMALPILLLFWMCLRHPVNSFHDEGDSCAYNVSTYESAREHEVVLKHSTKVTGLKKKQPTRRSNTRPKSFMEKAKKKNKIHLPIYPPLQPAQVPCPPLSDATTTTGLGEGISPMILFRIISSIISWKSISTPKGYFISERVLSQLISNQMKE